MDPTLRPRVVERLRQEIPALPRGLGRAAKYLLDHPSDFGLDPIRETARKAGVSPYTLVRLAERLGFDGFEALRAPFRQALVSTAATLEPPGWIDSLRAQGETGRVQAEAALNGMAIVQRSLEGLDAERVDRVVDLLMAAPNVYLTAARSSYALAYYLHYVGRMALPSLQLIPRHVNSPVDELAAAQPGEALIAITFTPYSRETIEACRIARRRGLRLVMIADSEIVSPEFKADETLVASVLTTHHLGCYAGAMALIETLIAQLVARGGAASRDRIAAYEALRHESQAYWAAPKKR